MNRLSAEKRAQVVRCLVEGNSIRATVRMTGVAKNTVTKLLVDLGGACSIHMDSHMRDLPCKTLEVDEIWAFVDAKQKNASPDKQAQGWGDVWTWVAIDADSKLVPSFRVGARDMQEAAALMHDVAKRMSGRVQLTTDGLPHYIGAVRGAFQDGIDYAQLQKIYGGTAGGNGRSPGPCIGTSTTPISGSPDPAKINTSYVERQNLTMRMSMRRFTRLTNAFSKKVENLAAAVSLHFAYYNYCRVHASLNGQTPAMAAGLEDHVWTVDELIGLLEAAEAVPIRRGTYAKTRARKAELRGEIST